MTSYSNSPKFTLTIERASSTVLHYNNTANIFFSLIRLLTVNFIQKPGKAALLYSTEGNSR